MQKQSRNGIVGLGFIGVGIGLSVIGFFLVAPVCVSWSRSKLERVYRKGREGLESAADAVSEMANRAQRPLGEAVKAARLSTAVAAGAVETAAHYVRERVS
jgi:hypothetical protein